MTVLAWFGAVAPWLFMATFLLDGATRPGYQPMRHVVSALALGERGWIQNTNFIVCGLAITAGAVALPQAFDSYLVAGVIVVFGLALFASGLFRLDPMAGYPPGSPQGQPPEPSRQHVVHNAIGTVVFLSLPLAAAVAAFVLPDVGWKIYSAVTALLGILGLVTFGRAFDNVSPRAGLLQRATIIVGWTWLGLLFAFALWSD